MEQYVAQLRTVLSDPFSSYKPNRTGVDTISRFGWKGGAEHDLSRGFPITTTKKVGFKSATVELLWFLRGDTNVRWLEENGVSIWTQNAFQRYLRSEGKEAEIPIYSEEWYAGLRDYGNRVLRDEEFAKRHGDLGPIYGRQWRRFETSDGRTIDQLGNAIAKLRVKPFSRDNIVSAWNPEDIEEMELPPCHTLYQFSARRVGGRLVLDMQLYQRSADMFLGVPFNKIGYAGLQQVVAAEVGMKPGLFSHTIGDAHIYCGRGTRGKFYSKHLGGLKTRVRRVEHKEEFLDVAEWLEEKAPPERTEGRVVDDPRKMLDHVPAVLEQMSRAPRRLPTLKLTRKPFEHLEPSDFQLVNYNPHPPIPRAMAV